MKKVLVIPDVHGIDEWKSLVKNAILSNTHVVFLGDYVDSYVEEGWTIFENLKDIVEFKKKYPDKITLLLGNHDYAYIYRKPAISGYNYHMATSYRSIFEDNRDLFEIAWGYKGKNVYTLLTHAGLTNCFYDNIVEKISDSTHSLYKILYKKNKYKKMPLHELLNLLKDQVSLMWQIGWSRNGDSKYGGVLWADRQDLIDDYYPGIDQIVGHTRIPNVEIKTFNDAKLYFIDTHDERKGTLTGFLIELD